MVTQFCLDFGFKAYFYRPLSLAYVEAAVVRRFVDLTHADGGSVATPPLRRVLLRLGALHAAFRLDRFYSAHLLQGALPCLILFSF